MLRGRLYDFSKYLSSATFRNFKLSHNNGAVVAFKLSDIGEGIREVIVKEWYVKEGDKVSQFDQLCEVQSDKASVTITSRYDGVVKKMHYGVDDVALVGKPLVDIETEDAPVPNVQSTDPPKRTTDLSKPSVATTISITDKEILTIPSVRRLAKEHKVNLSEIKGSGKVGRILKEDVLKYLSLDKPDAPQTQTDENRIEPVKGFQKVMVKTMTDSLKIPHMVYGDEIHVTKLSKLRHDILNNLDNVRISYLPFFIKALSNALVHFPILNASLDETCENIIYKQRHNIGIAMDTKIGLAVPVIKNVASLSIMEINSELARLMLAGKNGNFTPQDLSDATFTISNIGAIGGTYMKPIITSPQVAIVALGEIKTKPRFDDQGVVQPQDLVTLSAAADHRIIDGGTIARFSNLVKKQIENPYLLLLNVS